MTDEIKEVFPKEFGINKNGEMVAEISLKNLNKIIDYITNLQEELKEIKEEKEYYQAIVESWE